MKAVVTLSNKVKIKTEKPSDKTIVKARLALVPPAIEPPTITGNNGKIQGAKTVSMPAKKEINKNPIIFIIYKLNLKPIQMPINPPTAVKIIEEKEKTSAPQRYGTSPPRVEPTNKPTQIKNLEFTYLFLAK